MKSITKDDNMNTKLSLVSANVQVQTNFINMDVK